MIGVAEAWAKLGIAATDDKREVKRAYGRALKSIDPETDPQVFIELREAYEAALEWGTQTPFWEDEAFEETLFPDPAEEEGADLDETEPCEDYQWERWRPEPPAPAGDGGLGEACAELDRLLFADPPPPAERIAEAGRAVMAHPGLANVDRLTETELWIAEVISASVPRSDPLIEPAIARFGWKQAERDLRRPYQISQVLARLDDLLFLKICHRGDHEFCPAVEALTAPPPDKLPLSRLTLAGPVRRFLDTVANEHPTLEQDLDPDSLAWWRAYLHGRHLPPDFVILMVTAPLLLTFAAAFLVTSQDWPLWLVAAAYPLCVLAVWAGLVGKAEIEARARRRLIEAWSEEAQPSAVVERVAAAALALPPLAALLPNGPLWTGLSAAASLALVAAGLRWGWGETGWETNQRARVFLPIVAAVVGGTILAAAPVQEAAKLALPLLVLCWLGSRLYGAMQLRSPDRPPKSEIKAIATSLVLIILVPIVIARAGFGDPAALWALLLLPSAIVGGHLAAAGSAADVHSIEWPLRLVGLIVYFGSGTLGEEQFWLRLTATTAVYALLYVAALVAVSLYLSILRLRREGSGKAGIP